MVIDHNYVAVNDCVAVYDCCYIISTSLLVLELLCYQPMFKDSIN